MMPKGDLKRKSTFRFYVRRTPNVACVGSLGRSDERKNLNVTLTLVFRVSIEKGKIPTVNPQRKKKRWTFVFVGP